MPINQFLTPLMMLLVSLSCLSTLSTYALDVLSGGTVTDAKKLKVERDVNQQVPPQSAEQRQRTAEMAASPDMTVPNPNMPIPPTLPPMPTPVILPSSSGTEAGAVTIPKVRELKRETLPLPGSKNHVQKLPAFEVTPGSIHKIFLVLGAANIDQKALLKAIKALKNKIQTKFLIIQNKSIGEISGHLNPKGKLAFDVFSESVRANFPFRNNERMIYLVDAEMMRFEGSAISLFLTNSPQGVAAVSLHNFPLAKEDSQVQMSKVLKAITARFYNITSTCGVLADATTLEKLEKLPQEYCPEDLEIMKGLKLIP